MNPILFSIIFIPVVEIYLFIKIGAQIGALTTILLIFITAILGVYYARYEGLNTLKAGFTQLSKHQTPAYEVISGATIAFNYSRFCNRCVRIFFDISDYQKNFFK